MRTPRLAAALSSLAVAAAAHGQEKVVYVDQAAPVGGDGSSWQAAFRDLTQAVAVVNAQPMGFAGAVINVAQGVYRPSASADVNAPAFEFRMRATAPVSAVVLEIRGGFAGLRVASPDARDFVATPTIITADVLGDDRPGFINRADNAATTLAIVGVDNPVRPTLSGLVLRGGTSRRGSSGGGLAITNTSSTYLGSPLVESCVIEDNEAEFGAGVNIVSDGIRIYKDLVLSRSIIRRNRARLGGGAVSSNTTLYIRDCLVAENSASWGGAICIYPSSDPYSVTGLALERSRFAANRADSDGGAVYVFPGVGLSAESCLFDGNQAGRFGGALYQPMGYIVGCTFTRNQADAGGAMMIPSNRRVFVERSIIWGNLASDSASDVAIILSAALVLQFSQSIISLDPARVQLAFQGIVENPQNAIDADPMFTDPDGPDNNPDTWQDNDYTLAARSPGVDAVPPLPIWLPTEDLLGNPVPRSGFVGAPARYDLGCYERQTPICPADMDADGGVDASDLVEFLALFAAGGLAADVDDGSRATVRDRSVTIEDLLWYLERFAAGC